MIAHSELISAIETLLKEAIHPDARAYLRALLFELTNKDLPT